MAQGGRRASELSQAGLQFRMSRYTLPRIGHLLLHEVTAEVLEALYADLATSLGHGSIKNVHYDISGVFKLAQRYEWIDDNPALRAERKAYERAEIVPPKPADIERLLAHLDEAALGSGAARDLALAVRIALVTGARCGEIASLRWCDVDLEQRVVTIRSTKNKVVRSVGMGEALVERLREHLVQVEEAQSPRTVLATDGVFRGEDGDQLASHTLSTRFRYYRAQVGLDGCRFHDLRHFAASVFLAEMSAVDASRAIGHKRVSTTTDIYGHMLREEVDFRGAEAIEARVKL
jgi:integrase